MRQCLIRQSRGCSKVSPSRFPIRQTCWSVTDLAAPIARPSGWVRVTARACRRSWRAAGRHLQRSARASAAAYAWFEKRVAPEAGTRKAVARTTPRYARDRGQFDCFDKTHNATELLALLAYFALLRHHVIDVPQSRGLLIDLRQHHTTAVVREKVSGKRWSVDGWTKNNGQLPDIMPMERWAKED